MRVAFRAIIWWSSIVALLTLVAVSYLRLHREYDYQESTSKLRDIGRALRIYRSFQRGNVVQEKSPLAEVGLPRLLLQLAERDHPWSLPEGINTFKLESPGLKWSKGAIHFSQLYWDSDTGKSLQLPDISNRFSARGEDLPVMADLNMLNDKDFKFNREVRVVILRLGGRVDQVSIRTHELSQLWRK